MGVMMLIWLKSAGRWLRRVVSPSDSAWTAAAYALLTLWGLLLVSFVFSDGATEFTWESTLGLTVLFGLMALVSVALLFTAWLLGALKLRYRAALLLCLPPISLVLLLSWGAKGLIALPVFVMTVSLLFGAGAALIRPGIPRSRSIGSWVFFAVGVALAGLSGYVLLKPAPELNAALSGYHLRDHTLDLRDPSKPGPYGVKIFTYGSGVDRHRPEYAGGVAFRSKSVDGSKLDLKWTGLGGWVRSRYWGFGPDRFPVQGRVWMPVPEGIKLDEGEEDRQPLDWSIVLTDAEGAEARLPLSHDQLLYPQIKNYTRRFGAISSTPSSEVVMRRYCFPLKDFVAVNPRLDLKRLRSIRFDFDRTQRGVIALDDVGLMGGP